MAGEQASLSSLFLQPVAMGAGLRAATWGRVCCHLQLQKPQASAVPRPHRSRRWVPEPRTPAGQSVEVWWEGARGPTRRGRPRGGSTLSVDGAEEDRLHHTKKETLQTQNSITFYPNL